MDFTLNWASWLGIDTISVSTWTLPAGITSEDETLTTTTTTIWLSGGSTTLGTIYEITNEIVTAAGRTEQRSIFIQMAENKHGVWSVT